MLLEQKFICLKANLFRIVYLSYYIEYMSKVGISTLVAILFSHLHIYLVHHILTTAHPIHNWKAIMPTQRPLCRRCIGAAPLTGTVVGFEVVVFEAPGALLPRARPRQSAMLKKISILLYTPPNSSWQGPIANTGTSVRECTPWGSYLGFSVSKIL